MTQYLLEEACMWMLDVHEALAAEEATEGHQAARRHAELRAIAARQVGR